LRVFNGSAAALWKSARAALAMNRRTESPGR